MDNDDVQRLRLRQTELFVAQQIYDALGHARGRDVQIEPLPLNDIASGNVTDRDFVYQQKGLELLEEKKLIKVLNRDAVLKTGIKVKIQDVAIFKAFYNDLFQTIPARGHGARIVYSTKTGDGKTNGKPFKLNKGRQLGRNRSVFEYLVKRPNQYHTKQKLWQIAGEKGVFIKNSDNVNTFNDIITALRPAVKISSKHLRLNKTVILDAEVTLTD